jgi:hypothetical protein
LRKPKPTKVCSATGRRRRNSSSTPPTIYGLLGDDAQFLTFNNVVAGTNIVSLKQRSRKISNKIIMPFQLLLKN